MSPGRLRWLAPRRPLRDNPVLILLWILKPIKEQWPHVRDQILTTSPIAFIVASLMFALFLFLFRALVWRQILVGFGHPLPVRVATRIWSISELARYLPTL